MTVLRQRVFIAAVLAGAAGIGAGPAIALEIFGFRLWGAAEENSHIEIIDPLPYSIEIEILDAPEELETLITNSSSLWIDRDEPASGLAGLLSKARGDYRRILAALYNAGYYAGEISIRADGREVADISLDAALPDNVPMVVEVRPGRPFSFGRTAFVNPPVFQPAGEDAVASPASIGYAQGEPARASVIGAASSLAIEQWRQLSHAKAREVARGAVADHETALVDALIEIDPGPPAYYGATSIEGNRRVATDIIAFMTDLPQGEPFDPDEVTQAQDRLARLGVFRSIRVEEAEEIGPDGSLDMQVLVDERPPRTFGVGATLSTLDGAGLETYWEHRNILGRAERLRFEASVTGLGRSTNPDEYDYVFGTSFMKPGVYTPDTNFIASVVARQLYLDTYDERSISATAGVSQVFGRMLTGDLQFGVSRARFEDDFGVRRFLTFGPIARVQYDRRDDPLEPTSGYYLAGEARPFYELEYGYGAVRGTAEGRIYRGFGEDSRFVLAGRAKLGSYNGPDASQSPPDILFFAGGGGSVRGYSFRSIGVEGPGEAVVGGRGLFEASGELRARFGERFGVVGFMDAGFVSSDARLAGDNELRVGAGLGVRYYTGIGALRFDLAAPVDPRPEDSRAAFYIGIGQAF